MFPRGFTRVRDGFAMGPSVNRRFTGACVTGQQTIEVKPCKWVSLGRRFGRRCGGLCFCYGFYKGRGFSVFPVALQGFSHFSLLMSCQDQATITHGFDPCSYGRFQKLGYPPPSQSLPWRKPPKRRPKCRYPIRLPETCSERARQGQAQHNGYSQRLGFFGFGGLGGV